jgi:ribosome maturation factor RimP
MSAHFERARQREGRSEAELRAARPEIDVLDVELDDRAELVRVFIDHENGIGFEECTAVNEVIRDTCPDHALEVSSPGLERPMRRAPHFAAHIGETVRLRREGVHKAGKFQIVAVDEAAGVTFQPEGGEEFVVPFDKIVRCKLVVDDPFAAAAASRQGKGKGSEA